MLPDPADSPNLRVVVEPEQGTIDGLGTARLTVRLTGTQCGLLKRTIKIFSSPHGRPIELPVEMAVVGPELVLRTRALNYGLLPLGEARTQSLIIQNMSKLPARFMLAPAGLPNTAEARQAASAQAAAMGGGLGQLEHEQVERQVGWAWASDAAAAARAETLLESAHMAAGIEPSACFGTVQGGGTVEVPITLRPACEQSLRRNLALLVEHGPSAYVAVRSEVVQRRACLSLSNMVSAAAWSQTHERPFHPA